MGRSRNGFRVLYPFYLPSRIDLLPRMTTIQPREPSELEYDTEETDPEEDRDDVEGDDDDVSVGSNTTSKSSGHNTDRTNRTTTANRTQRHNQGSIRKVGGGIPPMLGRKRKGVRARWSCLYSRTPRRKVP